MQHLTKSELESLLREAKSNSYLAWLAILVSYWHGLRVSETINLTGSDIRDGYVSVKRLKGSNATIQPLITSANPLLDEKQHLETLASVRGTDKLFPVHRNTVLAWLKKYGQAAGIPEHKCHPHVLKHTCAMHSIKIAGIENVRAYLGHKTIASTGEYLKVSDEEASKAVSAAMGF